MRQGWKVALGLSSALFVACGGDVASFRGDGSDGGVSRPTTDGGGDDASTRYGAATDVYPAFKPAMGELLNNGGPVFSDARIVTVTWQGDPLASQLEDFVDKLGPSSYWKATLEEYGIGAATSGAINHVRIAQPPVARMTDEDVMDLLRQNVGKTLPMATSQTIYLLFLPEATGLDVGAGSLCQAAGGYHDEAMLNGTLAAYAVIARCGGLEEATVAASHALSATTTDPLPSFNPAWRGYTDATLAFQFWVSGAPENSEPCAFLRDAAFADPDLGYSVQRIWSSKAARAGASPCQPASGPYFNVTPLYFEDVVVDPTDIGGIAGITAKGFRATLKQTITFAVGFISDAPTSGPWTLEAIESNPLSASPTHGRLDVSVDPRKQSGVNGEITYVTVQVNQIGMSHAEVLTLISTLGSRKTYLPVLIGDNWPP